MKDSAKEIANQFVKENKEFIEGNISEYLINEIYEYDNIFYEYLTDEEMEKMNGIPEIWDKLSNELYDMIRTNFNYDITEF